MIPHRSRKRSLSASHSPSMATKKWITAAAIVLGSFLIEMDSRSVVIAFAPVHSNIQSSPVMNRNTKEDIHIRYVQEEPVHRRQRHEFALFSATTLFDEEMSTENDIRSISLSTSSILEEEQDLNSKKDMVYRTKSESVVAALKQSNQEIQHTRLRVFNDSNDSSTGNHHAQDKPSKKRKNRMVRPKIRSSNSKNHQTPKKRISTTGRSVRTLQIDGARMDDPKNDQKLLSREEERHLTHKVRSLRRAVRVRDSLVEEKEEWASYHPSAMDDEFPSEHQWAEACGLSVMDLRRVMMEGQESRSILVSANTGLVTSIAKRHYYALKHATETGGGVGTILTLQDMIQEGNLGLMKAAERFDADRGFRFSTYATYWIRQRILRCISDSSRVIRLPAYVHAQLQKINKARRKFTQEIGRVPSDPELAHFMKMSVDELRKIVSKAQNVVSLESPIRKGTNHKSQVDERTIGDFIASDAPTPEEDAQRVGLLNEIQAVMNELAERERMVLVLRYGLENGEPMSLSRTASEIGISLDQVRHVEARALTKLRCPQRNYRLKEYVGGHTEADHSSCQPGLGTEHPAQVEKMWFF